MQIPLSCLRLWLDSGVCLHRACMLSHATDGPVAVCTHMECVCTYPCNTGWYCVLRSHHHSASWQRALQVGRQVFSLKPLGTYWNAATNSICQVMCIKNKPKKTPPKQPTHPLIFPSHKYVINYTMAPLICPTSISPSLFMASPKQDMIKVQKS